MHGWKSQTVHFLRYEKKEKMENVVATDMSISYLPETRTNSHPWLSECCPGHVTHFGQLDMNEFMHSFLVETVTATFLPWPSSPTSVSYEALSNSVSVTQGPRGRVLQNHSLPVGIWHEEEISVLDCAPLWGLLLDTALFFEWGLI